MGNKLGRKRQVVDEKYTKPQGMYQHKDVDHKKLRKLILESKLAPCYPGDEDCTELEECPICFLYYPTLNRSRCCLKSICTECFLQMKTPNSTRPTQCPFCKTSNYAVEYRGAKTKEEKGIEQIEEQRVIEAKIRMRQQEVQDDEERTQKRLETGPSDQLLVTMDVESSSTTEQSSRNPVEAEEIVSAQDSCATTPVSQHLHSRQNRETEFDLDLEDVMVMEAIWLSIQEKGLPRNSSQGEAITSSDPYLAKDYYASPITHVSESSSSLSPSPSPSGGLACAIAALAERQQTSGHGSSTISIGVCDAEDYSVRSTIAKAETSEASFDENEIEIDSSFHNNIPGPGPEPIIPESFEEQMMLAMAVSLAEARALPGAQEVAWH